MPIVVRWLLHNLTKPSAIHSDVVGQAHYWKNMTIRIAGLAPSTNSCAMSWWRNPVCCPSSLCRKPRTKGKSCSRRKPLSVTRSRKVASTKPVRTCFKFVHARGTPAPRLLSNIAAPPRRGATCCGVPQEYTSFWAIQRSSCQERKCCSPVCSKNWRYFGETVI